jgi:DNA ligase 1
MKTFVEAISQAEQFPTKKEKFEALTGMDQDAQRLVHEALNPYRVFGVRKYDWPKTFMTKDLSFSRFFNVLDKLHDRELTGNAAREAVTCVLSLYTEKTATYLARVLDKDLECGANETTFNKLYPNLVPTFSVMLASKVDDKYDWQFPAIAEAKYDGTRLIAVCENGAVTYFSRSGKPADFCDGLFDEDLSVLEGMFGHPIVVDGEALASNFTETLNAKGSKGKEAKLNLRYYVFDVMSLDDWEKQECAESQAVRSNTLERFISALNEMSYDKLIKSKHRIIRDMADAREFYEEMLAEGYEGLIIKRGLGKYEWDRSKNWAKWKPVLDFDLKITGVFEGRGRLEGRLGGFYVSGEDENGNVIETSVGSGFSDKQRDEFWKNQKKYIGKIAMLEAQEMSKSANSDTYSLRFPVFIKIRDDK